MSTTKSSALTPPTRTTPGRHRIDTDGFPWSAVLVLIGALVLGAVLNAGALLRTANALQPGWQRDVALAGAQVLVSVGKSLHLDSARLFIESGPEPAPPSPAPVPAPSTTSSVITTNPTSPSTTTTSRPSTTVTTLAPTTTIPGVFSPTAAKPARLWVAGDSLTERFGPSLVNRLSATGVVDSTRNVEYSTGLTRPDFFDWPAFLDQGLTGGQVDILVFMIGANDGQPIETAAGWVPFGSNEWVSEYRRRVATTMDLIAEEVPTAYWIGQPIARSDDYTMKMAVMDEIYESEAASRPSIHYFDTWPLFSDVEGKYSAYLPGPNGDLQLMRATDGIHLSVEGGERLATAVADLIASDWALPTMDGN